MYARAKAAVAPRFVRVSAVVVAYGVHGTGTFDIDAQTGRFARRFSAGAASEGDGWNGTSAWRSDATGMGRVQGNAAESAEVRAFGSALRRALLGGVRAADLSSGRDQTNVAFDGGVQRCGLHVPARIVSRSGQNGVWTADVRRVATPAWLGRETFSPGAAPHDWRLSGKTVVPVSMAPGSPQITVRVNGVPLQVYLDTGGQNVLSERAARAAGIELDGKGIVRGGAGGSVPIRYGFAHTVRVGSAEMQHQPFIVLPDGALGVDAVVGYELLARFAAKLDMVRGTLTLARDAAAFGPPVQPQHFGYFDRQPQVDGAIDTIAGPVTLDTGSSLAGEVPARAVRDHRLVERLHAHVAAYAADVGVRYAVFLARSQVLRIGSARIERPLLALNTRFDPTDTPAILVNVGSTLLKRWLLVFDYAHQTVDLRPGGDTSGNVVFDHSGLALAAQGGELIAVAVLTGTPAARAGLRTGMRIVAVDGRAVNAADRLRVRSALRGAPGTVVHLRLGDGTTRALTLERYL